MATFLSPLSVLLAGVAVCCTACSSVKTGQPELVAPPALDYCNICLTCIKSGESSATTYLMGEQAPMPKLKIFAYKATGSTATISFDGVGNGKAVHFNGQLQLTAQSGNSYTFTPQGTVEGFEGESENRFAATPVSLTINILPAPAL